MRRLLCRIPLGLIALALGVTAAAAGASLPARHPAPQPPPQPAPEQHAAGLALFDTRVRTILVTHCLQCHGEKEDKVEGEFNMMTRDGLLKGGTIGVAVVPGSAEDSMLMWLIRHEDEPRMPEDKPKLADADIAAIAAWIDAGAPYSKPLAKAP